MKVIYEAKDGTQFNTEEECQEYEAMNCAMLDRRNFLAADADGNPVPPTDSYGYNIDNFDYFVCFTKEGLEGCKELFRDNAIHLDFQIELNKVYHYNYDGDAWQPLSEKLGYLRHEIARLSYIERILLSAKQS